ncbi:MAG: transcriptional regulator [Steroidobacteraceae bacterium]
MNNKLFAELVNSTREMGEIVRGERAPSREFHVDAVSIKKLRADTGLSQAKFAALIAVEGHPQGSTQRPEGSGRQIVARAPSSGSKARPQAPGPGLR